jgi:hypothetical protein
MFNSSSSHSASAFNVLDKGLATGRETDDVIGLCGPGSTRIGPALKLQELYRRSGWNADGSWGIPS